MRPKLCSTEFIKFYTLIRLSCLRLTIELDRAFDSGNICAKFQLNRLSIEAARVLTDGRTDTPVDNITSLTFS